MNAVTRCAAIAAVFSMGVVAAPFAASSGVVGAAIHRAAAASCKDRAVRTTVSATSTGVDGTGFAMAETNVGASKCSLASPLVVQFLTANGVRVTGGVSSPAFGANVIAPSYQGTFSVSARSATHCARRPQAVAIRVTSGTATSVVHLARAVRLCASRSHAVTVSPVAFPHPSPCAANAILDKVGWGNGAAGTIYYAIRFQNTGLVACTVHGLPAVQPISSGGAPMGPPARQDHVGHLGVPMVLGLRDGVAAWSSYGVVEAGNFPVPVCGPVDVWGIRVDLPGYGAQDLMLPVAVCTKLVSTNVVGVAPKWIEP
jgi:Protein of unknown function (DUF4232)